MVPEGWSQKQLGDFSLLQRGLDLPEQNRKEGNIPIISSSGVTGYHNEAPVKAPGVVTGRYGTVGNVFYIKEDFWPLNTSLWVKDFHGNNIKYVYYVLSKIDYKKFSDKTGVPGVNRNDLHRIKIPVPPIAEQTKIAKILTTWDTAIAQMAKLVEANRKLKTGLMQQLLTGKRRFSGFKDKWQMLSVKDLCTYIGSGGTPSTSVPEYWSGTIPWITGADFTERGIGVVRRYITDEAVQSSATRVCPQESILLVSRTGVGKIALAPFNVAVSQDITVLELTPNFTDPQFILFALAMSLSRLQRFNQGTSINGVMRKDLICHQIFVPSLQEQKKISTVLRAMDAEIDSLTSYVEQLQEQKRGLMQKLLTGQIRVKTTEEITV